MFTVNTVWAVKVNLLCTGGALWQSALLRVFIEQFSKFGCGLETDRAQENTVWLLTSHVFFSFLSFSLFCKIWKNFWISIFLLFMPLQFLLRNVVQGLLWSAKNSLLWDVLIFFFLFLNKKIKMLPLQFIAEEKKNHFYFSILTSFPPIPVKPETRLQS